jgi:hypothetical protein
VVAATLFFGSIQFLHPSAPGAIFGARDCTSTLSHDANRQAIVD